MSDTGLIFHNDLDGLMSAMLIVESEAFNIEKVFPVDYGHDHAGIKDQCSQFVIVDYADNITEEKTVLWLDHHLKEEGFKLPEAAIIKEAPSCVRLLKDSGMADDTELSEEDVKCIDIVDSADYPLDEIGPEDVIFPDINTKLGQWTALNQLLMKNRKKNLSVILISEMIMDPKTMLYKAEKAGKHILGFDEYMQRKQKLMEKIIASPDEYIQYFSGVPVAITRTFSQYDWKGYDRNLFYYLANESPYVVVTFDMGGQFNFQVSRNLFAKVQPEKDVYTVIKDVVDEIRGHENILNFSFEDKNEGLAKLDEIIDLLSKEI